MFSSMPRRSFLGFLAAALLPRAAKGAAPVVAGAIRWDAWYERRDASVAAQRSLSDPRFSARAPAHCEVREAAQVECVGSEPAMEAEIASAHGAGLSYWAFCWFPPDSSFRSAWNLYQASRNKDLINWCAIVTAADLGAVPFRPAAWRAKIDEWVRLMAQPTYQKIGDNRPLMYIFYREEEFNQHLGGDRKNLAPILSYLREKCAAEGLGAPYVVLFNPAVDVGLLRDTGVDATSNYISNFSRQRNGTFAALAAQARTYWRRMAASGFEVVPIAQLGWDTRPRLIRPVPWGPHGGTDPNYYYAIATPQEFEAHIRDARAFVDQNARACPHRLLLIYSWNECDEGGCMMPTHGDRAGRLLQALRRALG